MNMRLCVQLDGWTLTNESRQVDWADLEYMHSFGQKVARANSRGHLQL